MRRVLRFDQGIALPAKDGHTTVKYIHIFVAVVVMVAVVVKDGRSRETFCQGKLMQISLTCHCRTTQ